MKPLILSALILCLAISCKKSKLSTVPDGLTGKWRLVSREITQNGTTKWQNPAPTDSRFLYFSKYGEAVNSSGYLIACGPTSLEINGSIHKIEFHSDQEKSPFFILCADCSIWNIDLEQNELVLNKCAPQSRTKYKKE